MKQTKKQLRTLEWKTKQLEQSISDLCYELVQKSKEAAQEKWENKNNSTPEKGTNNVLTDGEVEGTDKEK